MANFANSHLGGAWDVDREWHLTAQRAVAAGRYNTRWLRPGAELQFSRLVALDQSPSRPEPITVSFPAG